MENVWGLIKRKLSQDVFKDLDEMKIKIDEIVSNFNIETIQSLIASMPRRMQAVIESKGDITKY